MPLPSGGPKVLIELDPATGFVSINTAPRYEDRPVWDYLVAELTRMIEAEYAKQREAEKDRRVVSVI